MSQQPPNEHQLRACRNCKLDPETVLKWVGRTMVLPYWGAPDSFALVNEHGSVTYCTAPMLEAHLRGIPQ